MYNEFFGFKASPFTVSPDPRFLVPSAESEETLASLTYGVQERRGFILLTGEVGTGKTTILNMFLEWLRDASVATAFVFNPRLNINEFLDFMMTDFGISCPSELKSQKLIHLNHWLLERYQAGETAVLIVDEAQNLSGEVLEEIRLLTNLETTNEKLLQIVLSGQPELEYKLRQPALRQLRQRVTLWCKTQPLSQGQVSTYISERLRIAGWEGSIIFSPRSVEAIYDYSQGIPRVINLLCDHALIDAFADDRKFVSAVTIDNVAKEFGLERELSADDPTPANGGMTDEQKSLALEYLSALDESVASKLLDVLKGSYEPNSRCVKES